MIKEKIKKIRIFSIITALMLSVCMISSCGGSGGSEAVDALADMETADMSGYNGLADYDKETVFVEVSVAEMDEMIKDSETFAVFFGYAECPYCNVLIPYLNDAALDAGRRVAYINTRKNPEWKSNMDIDDYDLVVKYFKDYIDEDDEGKLHLYVPDLYFINNGKIAAHHEGVTPGADDPDKALTSDQEKQLRTDLKDEFAALN